MKRQLLLNNIAAGGSQVWRVIGQLLVPPLLLKFWNIDKYGTWVLITTIPGLIALADVGFTDAAAADMTMHVARGDRVSAGEVFQAAFLISVMTAAAVVLLSAPVGMFVAAKFPGDESGLSLSVAALILYAALCLFTKFQLGALKAGGIYAASTLGYDFIQFGESVLVVISAWRGGSLAACALSLLAVRALNIAFLHALQRRTMPWLRYRVTRTSVTQVRRLLVPALAAFSIPLVLAANIQVTTWVAGLLGGAAAAATLVTVRTASRVLVQVVGIFGRAAMPLYSTEFAAGNLNSIRLINRLNVALLLGALLPGCLAFALFGPRLVAFWTHGGVAPEAGLVWAMAIAAFFHAAWYYRVLLLLSVNKHISVSLALFAITAIGLAVCAPVTWAFGLTGCGAAIAAIEMCTFAAYLWLSRAHQARPSPLESEGAASGRRKVQVEF